MTDQTNPNLTIEQRLDTVESIADPIPDTPDNVYEFDAMLLETLEAGFGKNRVADVINTLKTTPTETIRGPVQDKVLRDEDERFNTKLIESNFFDGDAEKVSKEVAESAKTRKLAEGEDVYKVPENILMQSFLNSVTRDISLDEDSSLNPVLQARQWKLLNSLITLQLSREFEEEEYLTEGFLSKMFNIIGGFAFMQDSTALLGFIEGTQEFGVLDQTLFAGRSLRETGRIFENLDPKERLANIAAEKQRAREQSGYFFENTAVAARAYRELANPDPDSLQFWNNAELLSLGIPFALAGKKVAGLYQLWQKLDDPAAREYFRKSLIEYKETGDTTGISSMGGDSVVGNSVNLSFMGGTDVVGDGMRKPGSYTNALIEDADKIDEAFEEAQVVFLQNEAVLRGETQVADAVKAEKKVIKQERTNYSLKDNEKTTDIVDIIENPVLPGQSKSLGIIVGQRGTTNPFTTPTGVHNSAVARGYARNGGAYEVFEGADGFYLKINRNIDETQYVPSFMDEEVSKGTFDQWLFGAHTLVDTETHIRVLKQQGARSNTMKALQPIVKQFKSLVKNERDKLGSFIQEVGVRAEATKNERWLSLDEMEEFYDSKFGRLPTTKEVSAYNSYIKYQDYIHWQRNHNRFLALDRKNYVSGVFSDPKLDELANSFSIKEQILKVDSKGDLKDIKKFVGKDYYDASTGKVGTLTEAILNKAHKDNFRMFTTNKTIEPLTDNPVSIVIGSKTAIKTRGLKYNQLGWRAGANRIYEGKESVQQANIISKGGEKGKKIIRNPRIVAIDSDPKKTAELVGKLEGFRKLYNNVVGNKKITAKQAQKEFEELGLERFLGVSSFKEARKVFDKGDLKRYNSDSPFENIQLDDTPRAQKNAEADINSKTAFDEEQEEIVDYSISSRGQFYSKRGDHVKDASGELAGVLDPMKAIDLSMSELLDVSFQQNFKLASAEAWNKQYGTFVTDEYAHLSASEKIFNDGVKFKLTGDELAKALNSRAGIRLLLHHENSLSRATRRWGDRLGRSLQQVNITGLDNLGELGMTGGELLTQGINRAGKGLRNKVDDGTLSQSALKSLAFNSYLGMWSWHNLLIQPSQSIIVGSAFPIEGAPSVQAAGYLQFMLTRNNVKREVVENYAKKVQPLSGMKADEFMELYDDLSRNGYHQIFDTVQQLDRKGGRHLNTSAVRHVYDGVITKGTWFFNESERFNRITAYTLAHKRLGKKYTKEKLAKLSPDEIRDLKLQYADGLNMNMTDAGVAFWQRAPALGVLTQFGAYPARYFETLIGKNGAFTGKERGQLVLAHWLLHGNASIPRGREYFDEISAQHGIEVHPDFYTAIQGGGLNLALASAGADIDLANSTAWGTQVYDMLGPFLSAKPDKNLFKNIPSIGLLLDTGDAITDVLQMGWRELTPPEDDDIGDFNTFMTLVTKPLLRNITSLNNLDKAKIAFQFEKYSTRAGIQEHIDLNMLEQFFVAMGQKPRIYTDLNRSYDVIEDESGLIRTGAAAVNMLKRQYMIDKPAGEELTQEEYDKAEEGLRVIRHFVWGYSGKNQDLYNKIITKSDKTYLLNRLQALREKQVRNLNRSIREQLTDENNEE